MATPDLSSLLQACEHIDKLPSPVPEAQAASFLEQAPLGSVFQSLSSHECTPQQLDSICTALGKVLATQHGTALLPGARAYAEAALSSPQHRLRRLGCEQLGRLLLLEAAGGEQQQQQQQGQLLGLLITALQDADTGVAGEAENALVAYVAASPPAAFAALLDGSSGPGQQLRALAADSSAATQRMRAFALLAAAAATSSGAAEQLKHSDVVTALLEQLRPHDPLACLVALQLLQDLVPHLGGGAAQLMQGLLLPALLPLLDDPATAAGAFPIAAQLAAAAAAAHGHGGPAGAAVAAAAANGNGVAAGASAVDTLLSRMAAVLDDRGTAPPEQELVVLDAAHALGLTSPASAALLAAPAAAGLLPAICARALGRTTPTPEVRLGALHALASVAGLERAGEARDVGAAALPAAAEEALRQGVYGTVAGTAGGVGGARSPAEAVWQLLQQPFDDMRSAVYRCCSALSLHPWFAVDACNNTNLLARLCRTDSESGQAACEWRHSAVMALWATVQALLAVPSDGSGAAGQYQQQLSAAAQQQLAAAVRGGPYGVGGSGRGTQQSHFVATVT